MRNMLKLETTIYTAEKKRHHMSCTTHTTPTTAASCGLASTGCEVDAFVSTLSS